MHSGVLSIARKLMPSLKVVNALLTQIDRLKHQKNVLIMTTSNLAKAIGDYQFIFVYNLRLMNPCRFCLC